MNPNVTEPIPKGEDQEFLKELYGKYSRLMFYVAYKATKDSYVVEELVSDACIALIKNVATLRTLGTIQLRAYIVNVMKSKIRDYFDRKAVQLSHYVCFDDIAFNMADQSADVEKRVILQEELDMILAAIDTLPDKERLVVLLTNQDVDYHTISQIVGISESSVHKYLSRARAKIRKIVNRKER